MSIDPFEVEPLPIICPLGDRDNCKYFKYTLACAGPCDSDMDDSEWWCEHPSLNGEDAKDICPIDKEDQEDAD